MTEVDWWPRNQFLRKKFRGGLDCGLVLVVNKPFDTDRDVKLIVLAGFSGIGTEGCARALVQDYRDLEPQNDGGMSRSLLISARADGSFGHR